MAVSRSILDDDLKEEMKEKEEENVKEENQRRWRKSRKCREGKYEEYINKGRR